MRSALCVLVGEAMDDSIRKVTDLIRRSQKVIVFTGAGVSTESGIPDFRSPGGIWQKYNPEDFYYQKFISSEESREKYWQMSREFYEPLKNQDLSRKALRRKTSAFVLPRVAQSA